MRAAGFSVHSNHRATIRAVVGLIQRERAAGAPALNVKHRRGWHYIVVNGTPSPSAEDTKGYLSVSDRRSE